MTCYVRPRATTQMDETRMTTPCSQTSLAEAYVGGELDDDAQARFEEHYFECDACFEAVQRLQDLQQVLAAERATSLPAFALPEGRASGPARPASAPPADTRPASVKPVRRLPVWAMAAAASLVAVAAVWSARTLLRPAEAPAIATQGGAGRAGSIPGGLESPPPPPVVRPDPWLALAVVTPPVYAPLPTRSATAATARAFEAAMTEYTAANYARAALSLTDVAVRAPDDARVQFFLGVSRLLAGDTGGATAPLQRAVALKVLPYSDEAHFYLAKAALAAHDRSRAEAELQRAVAAGAGPEGEAARLLVALETLPR